jgi:uncharacterized membrane protein required for colicin V production
MPTPTTLDAVVVGLPLLCGFLGLRAGLRRSLVSWPVRWTVAFVGAQVLLLILTVLVIAKTGIGAQLRALDPAIGRLVSVALLLVLLAILLAVTRSVRRRVLERIGDNFIGPIEHVFGGLFGLVGGLWLVGNLVVAPCMMLEAFQPDRARHPAWVRDAVSLPYIKRAGDALLSVVAVPARGVPQRP